MDLIHAKGSGFYGQGNVTLMKPQTIVDMVATQRRYEDAVTEAEQAYNAGEINLAEYEERVAKANFDRLHIPVAQRIQSQQALDRIKVQPVDEREDQGFLVGFNSVDFEVGIESNDFELVINKQESMAMGIELGDYIYCPGTEFGGIIDGRTIDTSSDEMIWTGTCWRGLLEADVIRPLRPASDAYRTVSGDLNTILRAVLAENGSAGSFFNVPNKAAGASVSNYSFPRYIDKLTGLKNMLASVGYRLKIWAENSAAGGTFVVWVEAVPIVNYSQEVEYSQDTNTVDVRMTQNFAVCNHLICLGDGELTARRVIDLYVDKNGNITTTRPANGFLGVYERIAIYDYSNIEGEDDAQKQANLLADGRNKLIELNQVNSMELTVDSIEIDVGDIIAGRDRTTGMQTTKAITNKILRIDAYGFETIELSVDGKEDDKVEHN